MINVTKRMLCVLLVLVLLGSGLPIRHMKAAETGSIYFIPKGEQGRYCECVDDAFRACQNKGGSIIIKRDYKLNFPDYIKYGVLNKNTTLVVEYGATLTIGENGFRMDGLLQIMGKVDLEHSEGLLYGDGSIQILDGSLVKRKYQIDRKEEKICLEGKDIQYGQALKDVEIPEDRIHWRTSIEGTWQFARPEQKPQAGTGSHDIIFKPRYPMTYEEAYLEECGQVFVKQAKPERKEYEPVKIHAGENLLGIQPRVTYVSPVTGEVISGEFQFDQAEQPQLTAGKQELQGTFVPQDSNYVSVTEYYPVEVETTKPQVTVKPLVRNQGTYGQDLKQIQFVPGKCVNPYTDKAVSGTWEWKDAAERLQLGTRTYSMLFIPAAEGYETVEQEMEVTTLPRLMEDIEWPSCSDLYYGDRLADATLSFDKNDYGTFFWENENLRPAVKNNGARLVFRPADTDTYDWSRLAGYDPAVHTVTFTIPIRVKPIPGTLPEIQASEVTEGTCVSGCALRMSPEVGEAEWQEPDQIVEKSGWYPVVFTPWDSDNYDWSSQNPDTQGKIQVWVYVKAQEKPVAAVPVPEPSAGTAVQSGAEGEIVLKQTAHSGSTKEPEITTFMITQLVSKASNIYTVTVKKTKIIKHQRKSDCIKLTWKKVKGVKYQIQYGTDRKWKRSRKKTVKASSTIIKGLKKHKKYYIRIRCIKTKKGRKYYSKWSKRKTFL